uniref:SAP domain-containing protein n=1 Tax=viral metagenome TaxID=1070528 RepID=A0A6C0KHB6_9ZZZZ
MNTYKIKDIKEDLVIPTIDNYKKCMNNNYTLLNLKSICRVYKLKVSGTKQVLKDRINQYLSLSNYAIIIQKNYRGYLQRRFIKSRGPGIYNRNLCVNKTDFLTLDDLDKIPFYQFYSFKGTDQYIYGFDICSLYNLIKKHNFQNNEMPLNPYNRQELSNNIVNEIRECINLEKIYKHNLTLQLEILPLNNEEKVRFKCFSLFQKIDELGNYTDTSWFLSLNRFQLIRFYRELIDIWNHRASLTNEIKRKIYTLHGSPFSYYQLNHYQNILDLKYYILGILENFIIHGEDDSYRSLAACYILAALTLVNNRTAEALPWLYESVSVQ